MDHGRDGERVNAVCPGLTETDLTQYMPGDEKLMAKFRERFRSDERRSLTITRR
ncbi:hypothetical protein AWB74_08462 [Caballeronia arvi]|uniref:Short-chain dehydrogenase/reductase SDR n=1 Tax=Caballeronia arvi TaxID=1777135 RepID=A0A158L5E7_9BURK|nr:hypothetical protein AWB74_08462 [Caballeronia arvi]